MFRGKSEKYYFVNRCRMDEPTRRAPDLTGRRDGQRLSYAQHRAAAEQRPSYGWFCFSRKLL